MIEELTKVLLFGSHRLKTGHNLYEEIDDESKEENISVLGFRI